MQQMSIGWISIDGKFLAPGIPFDAVLFVTVSLQALPYQLCYFGIVWVSLATNLKFD